MLSLLKAKIEINKLIREWRFRSEAIAEAAEDLLGPCKVYVFGSVVEGKVTGGSDVDVLIVAERLPENRSVRANLRAKVEEAANLPLYHPFEIHLATKEKAEANPIYRKAIDKGMALPTRKVGK